MMIAPLGMPEEYKQMATAIRVLSMDAVEAAKSGHPGMPMGMADVVTVLFRDFIKFNPEEPGWFDRDRFVLSAGHGSMLLYSLLYLTGYPELSLDEIRQFRQLHSKTPGHPEYGHTIGVETTTGPLGQGFANAVGMAIAEARLRTEFGLKLVNHKTYVLVGDGCLMEGLSQEALSLAGHLNLSNLIVLFDDNQITIDGPTSLSTRDNVPARFQASGWQVLRVDGHDYGQIYGALMEAQQAVAPTLICCRTTIAYGAPTKAGTSGAHGSPLGAQEVAAVKEGFGWSPEPFAVPDAVLSLWRSVAHRCKNDYQVSEKEWQNEPEKAQELARRLLRILTPAAQNALAQLKDNWLKEEPVIASRQASQMVLDALAPVSPEFIGGSADLTPSNNTKSKTMDVMTCENPGGHYIHYGIREHGMVAAMNGMALHGGVLPYGGTFLVFTDYCRPSIRLSALMNLPVVMVMTHDSIGLGEDGPTHQPVEHLASLRAIPRLNVFRPACALETLVCWELALNTQDTPSILALSRQNLLSLPHENSENIVRGGYIVKESTGLRKITFLATGSEVALALQAQAILEKEGVATAVVSLPCMALFDRQDPEYQSEVLGKSGVRIGIEAGIRQGWDKYLGASGLFLGLEDFGASAPAQELFTLFGLTVEKAVTLARTVLSA